MDSSKARPLPVRELLGKDGQLRLEHDGAIYLLRITRNGKLILTK
ncbi:hemin uptake protein HemP [Wenzhouxiangella sp. EGI_FJ10409]